jgi:glycosyltransferase involved in cell wall biosynthesis
VVVPLDPIEAYERAGHGDYLESYFNPGGMFSEVIALSPLERGRRQAFGMTVIGVPERQFAAALREIRPDVVRAYGGWWCSDLVCRHRVPGIPVVVSVHDSQPQHISASLRYADVVICVSETVRKQVLAVGVARRRTCLLPNRIDRSVFRPVGDPAALQAIASRFPSGRFILHVGRKVPAKNIDTVLRALVELPPEYRAVFVGMGDARPYINLAKQLGVDARCTWIDAIPNSALPGWYSWCDCLCVPSRTEGFGFVFIEAAACGAAIVTSDIGPMNEYLTDGVSAALVRKFEHPPAIAAAVRRACEDGDYRRQITAGARVAAEPFDKALVDHLEKAIYREAMLLSPLPMSRRLEIETWKLRRSLGGLRSVLEWRGRVRPAGAQ